MKPDFGFRARDLSELNSPVQEFQKFSYSARNPKSRLKFKLVSTAARLQNRHQDFIYSPISNKERDSTFTIGSERFPRYFPHCQNKNNDDSGSKGVGIGIFLFCTITRFPGGLEVRDRSFRTKGIPLMLQEVADRS